MRKGTVEVGFVAVFIGIAGVIIGKIIPFVAPALGALAIYFYTVNENKELEFKLKTALSSVFAGAIFGQAITFMLGKKLGFDSETTFYLGVLIGGITPILLMIITDKEFIAQKIKAFIGKITGG